MLRNYLIIAYRNLVRNRVYTALNVLGLTLGISCFCIIMLYVENELSHDKYQSNESYRFLVTEQAGDGETRTSGTIGVKTFNTIEEQISGIEDLILVRDHGAGPLLVEHGESKFKSRSFFFAEPQFFEYFDYEMIQGNPETALANPKNVVLTEATAKRIFGDKDPMGETIHFSGSMNFSVQVTAIIKERKNSHIQFDFLFNFDLRDEVNDYIIIREGFENDVYGYFKLESGVKPEHVTDQIKKYYQDYYSDNEEVLKLLDRESYELQSVYDIYFNSNHVVFDEGFKKGSAKNLTLLSSIGFFILLMACMNYINAATAKAANRAKEIGVRKVFGAKKGQLFNQFIGEAFLVTFLAILFSILFTDLALPFFENFMQTELRFALLNNPAYLIGLLIILVSVTFMSGLYPALVMSRYMPSQSLRYNGERGLLKGKGLRNILVGAQLFFAVVLISSIFLILQQNRFIRAMDLGYTTEDILIVPNNSQKVADRLNTFRNELMKSPLIHAVTVGMDVLGLSETNDSNAVFLEGEPFDNAPIASYFTVGMDFLDVQEIKVKAGRSYNSQLSTDSAALMVNEAFARAYGLTPNDIVGKRARIYGHDSYPMLIIGVVEDFNFQSLHSKVSPAIFRVNRNSNWFWTIKIDPNHKKEVVAHAQKSWEAIESSYPMGYWFLDDSLRDFYEEEDKLQKAIQVFAIICLVISCLGIYGLTTFTLERRTKEIGIRKVLGAGVKQLVWMVNHKFVRLFIISFILAVPLVYYAIGEWLAGFAYHIKIGASSFAMAGGMVLMVIFITVSIQAIKVALANPAKTLRTE